MKKIAVLGGSCEIGHALCKKLRDEGNYIVAYDRNYPHASSQSDWHMNELHIFDLCNDVDYFAAFRFQEFDEVYQVVGYSAQRGSTPADDMHNVARVSLNVLQVCRKANVKKLFCLMNTIHTDTTDWRRSLHAAYNWQCSMEIEEWDGARLVPMAH